MMFRNTCTAALTLVPASALAVPHAAAVVSPPLVVGGMLLGVVLIALCIGMLLRTYRTMQRETPLTQTEATALDVEQRTTEWERDPSLAVLQALVDRLDRSEEEQVQQMYAEALSNASARYFGNDSVAWKVWLMKDGTTCVEEAKRRPVAPHSPGEFLRVS